jgi:hypothetical protein
MAKANVARASEITTDDITSIQAGIPTGNQSPRTAVELFEGIYTSAVST